MRRQAVEFEDHVAGLEPAEFAFEMPNRHVRGDAELRAPPLPARRGAVERRQGAVENHVDSSDMVNSMDHPASNSRGGLKGMTGKGPTCHADAVQRRSTVNFTRRPP